MYSLQVAYLFAVLFLHTLHLGFQVINSLVPFGNFLTQFFIGLFQFLHFPAAEGRSRFSLSFVLGCTSKMAIRFFVVSPQYWSTSVRIIVLHILLIHINCSLLFNSSKPAAASPPAVARHAILYFEHFLFFVIVIFLLVLHGLTAQSRLRALAQRYFSGMASLVAPSCPTVPANKNSERIFSGKPEALSLF